jgi:hypothetical protein
LALARHWAATSVEEGGSGFSIVERYPTMGELTKALAENRVLIMKFNIYYSVDTGKYFRLLFYMISDANEKIK